MIHFLGILRSVTVSVSSASSLVKKNWMISFFFFCSSATDQASAIEYWSRAWSTCDSRVCVAPFVCHAFFVWHAFLCVTHSSVCVTTPFVVRHHVIHRSRRNNYLRWVSSDRMNITQFFVCIFTDFKSCFEPSAVESLQLILIHEFFPNLLLNTGSMTLLPIRVTSPKNLLVKRVCVHLSLGFTMVSDHTYLKMRVSTECLLHVCHPEIVVQILSSQILSSRWISLFIQMDFFLGCNRWRIAAVVAAAATAAFEEAGIFPLCGGNGFPMHARKFDLRFNVARILRT